jgi:hypothetical protein
MHQQSLFLLLNSLFYGIQFHQQKRIQNTTRGYALSSHFTLYVERKSTGRKSCSENVDEIDPWCQCHQHFTLAFFVRKFVQSQKLTRKKAFVCKICAFNIDEFDP